MHIARGREEGEGIHEELEGMQWYETVFFPISIRTTSDAVFRTLLISENRAAAFGEGWPVTYSGAVDPALASTLDVGKAAYRACFPAPFGISTLPITEQVQAALQAVRAITSSGGNGGGDVRLADAVIPNIIEGFGKGLFLLIILIYYFPVLSCLVCYHQGTCLSLNPLNFLSTCLGFKSENSPGTSGENAATGKARRE